VIQFISSGEIMEEVKRAIILPVASGKGGVGKTVLSVNISYALADLGKKTCLIDLDFGGANIHTCLGYDLPPDGIGNFILQKRGHLSDYVLSTHHKNLSFIPGDAEMVGIANISASQKRKLINGILSLDFDYIVIDLGAGSTHNTIDFFMLSSIQIVVATPELTSILNAYALLKNAIFRLLYVNLKKYDILKSVFESLSHSGGEESWKVSEVMDRLFRIDPEIHAEAATILNAFGTKLVINMAHKPKDIGMGERLRKISKVYLGIDMEYLGFLYRDKLVEDSIALRTPLAQTARESQTYQSILRMGYKITNARKFPQFLLDVDSYDEAMEEILDEATDDMSDRIEGYETLADENLLTVNELVSIVKNLEYENLELKRKVEKLEGELDHLKKRH
jgi:flagellar biosynthesis protein FlhG